MPKSNPNFEKPWAIHGITRRHYAAARPWKKTGTTKEKYAEMLNLIPHGYINCKSSTLALESNHRG